MTIVIPYAYFRKKQYNSPKPFIHSQAMIRLWFRQAFQISLDTHSGENNTIYGISH